MKIGIIGAGRIGRTIARYLTRLGHDVIVSNSRGPESLKSLVAELGQKAKAGTVAEAAAAPVVFLTVIWAQLPAALAKLPVWKGRIAVDTANPYVAEMVPGARLVKAFNTLFHEVLAAEPRQAGGRRVVFLSGDDATAKAEVSQLIDQMGFAAVDLGGLVEGGKVQQAGRPARGSEPRAPDLMLWVLDGVLGWFRSFCSRPERPWIHSVRMQ